MYRNGVGHVQLIQHIRGVAHGAVVKPQGQQLPGGVYLLHGAHIAVKNAGAHGAVVLFPQHIVVVFGLHHPVALPENEVAELLLVLCPGRRIQRRLEAAVQLHRAARAPAGRGQHLDVFRGNAHFFR